jgi:hypothetical protein
MKPRTAANGLDNVLSPRQEAAALALASGYSLGQAARKSGAGARTIRTWTAEVPAFVRRVSELRGEMTSQALGRLVEAMTSAADTLGFLSRKGKSETVRLGAARAVIEMGQKLRETVELEDRIAALESAQTKTANRRAS